MLTKACEECERSFPLREAKIDDHQSRSSLEPDYAYCPFCGAILTGVYGRSVEFARSLTLRNLLLALAWFGLFGAGVASDTLTYAGPLMLAALGIWLAVSSSLRDHRIIGWFLVVISGGVFVALGLVAA